MQGFKNTVSTIFMVPPLKISRELLEENNFINAYIKDIKKEVQYENCVYLLFKPDNFQVFDYFLDKEYHRTSLLVEDYDYDGGFVVLVYQLNDHFLPDFEWVKKGRYSKTSQEFQELFPKVKKIIVNGKHRDEMSLAHRIFKKSNDLKEYWEEKTNIDFTSEMEVWDGFDEEIETLNIDKIKALYD